MLYIYVTLKDTGKDVKVDTREGLESVQIAKNSSNNVLVKWETQGVELYSLC